MVEHSPEILASEENATTTTTTTTATVGKLQPTHAAGRNFPVIMTSMMKTLFFVCEGKLKPLRSEKITLTSAPPFVSSAHSSPAVGSRLGRN